MDRSYEGFWRCAGVDKVAVDARVKEGASTNAISSKEGSETRYPSGSTYTYMKVFVT